MRRREFFSGLAAGVFAAGPAMAQDYVADIINQLVKQGFKSIETAQTWLGRVRITALREDGQREIIVNPVSGEILRDLWVANAHGKAVVEIMPDGKASVNDGDASDDEDTGDDDGGDDDGDDDGEDSSEDSGEDSGEDSDDA